MNKMNSKIRFGVIGCSSIAIRSTIPAIKKTNQSILKIVGSRSMKRAKETAKKFSCELYGSYDEVLERKDVDAVYISLPIGLHEKWVIKSAKAGKHILCEKSIAVSYESATRMVKECKKNFVRIMEGFTFRFHPQHNEVLKIINQNYLGKVFSFSGNFGFLLPFSNKNFRFNKKLGGGALNDLGCYLICASRIIFQKKPLLIMCNLYNNKKNDVDIKGIIYMKYSKNLVATGIFGYENDFSSTYEIWGSKGLVSLDWAFNIRKNKSAIINLHRRNKTKKIKIKPVNQFELMIKDFCNELMSGGSSKFNFENDLIYQAQTMEAARLSNIKNQPIYLNEMK